MKTHYSSGLKINDIYTIEERKLNALKYGLLKKKKTKGKTRHSRNGGKKGAKNQQYCQCRPEEKWEMGLKVLMNYLMLFPHLLSHGPSDPFLVLKSPSTDRRSTRERRKKRKSTPSKNKSVEGKSRSCLPGARISSVRALRKTVRVGWGTKSSSKTKTKVAPKPPNKQPSTPALPSHARQAGPFGARSARGGPTPRQTPAYLENCCPKKTGLKSGLGRDGEIDANRFRQLPLPRAGDDGAGERQRGPSHECCSSLGRGRKRGREWREGGKEGGEGKRRGHEGRV